MCQESGQGETQGKMDLLSESELNYITNLAIQYAA